MEIILMTLWANFITRIAKKLGAEPQYVIVGLSMLWWAIYYLATQTYWAEFDVAWNTAIKVFWLSQVIYLFIIKKIVKE